MAISKKLSKKFLTENEAPLRKNSRPPSGMAKRRWAKGEAFIALERAQKIYFVSSSEKVPPDLRESVPESNKAGVQKLTAATEKWATEQGMKEIQP